MSIPTDLAGRRAKRKQIRDRAIAEAARHGLTITCAETADHSTCKGATVCLCECHDPPGGRAVTDLSPRQRECLALIAEGLTDREIAHRLSPRVRPHRTGGRVIRLDPARIGPALIAQREELGWSRADLARHLAERTGRDLHSHRSQLWKWEHGDCAPDLPSLADLLDILGYDLALIPREDAP